MTALIIGTAIALAAVAYVLVPLFGDTPPRSAAPSFPEGDRHPGTSAREGSPTAVAALREIEFDRATGKLSDADYETLKARYTEEALLALRTADNARLESERAAQSGGDAPAAADLAEELILRHRRGTASCVTCGPRPEPDAVYCSSCGRYLPGICRGCGSLVNEPTARFCASCGRSLAA